jgi:hypothetical protein
MINFRLAVDQPGDTASVKVYFLRWLSRGSKWMNYDPVQDVVTDYSDHAKIVRFRRYVMLELVDGGIGDADGVANGIIVNTSGLLDN